MTAYSTNLPTQNEVDARLGPKGYKIFRNVLTPDQVEDIRSSVTHQITWQIFHKHLTEGESITPENASEYLPLLIDQSLRIEKFGPEGAQITRPLGKGRNFFDTPHSKSTGMAYCNYNREVLRHIKTNPEIIERFREIYDYEALAAITGPERVSIKPAQTEKTKAPAMKKHIDMMLEWNEAAKANNYEVRAQGLVCFQRDTIGPVNKSGTLNLLVGFQHYWDLAGVVFHPETGIKPFPDFGKRFFVLPSYFEKKYLPILKDIAKQYRDFLFEGVVSEDDDLLRRFRDWQAKEISVPRDLPDIFWEAVDVRPGDMVIWSQRLPHQSLGNSSATPRGVCYLSYFPVVRGENGWFNTPQANWVRYQYANLISCYGVNNGDYNLRVRNLDEQDYIKHFGIEQDIRELLDQIPYITASRAYP